MYKIYSLDSSIESFIAQGYPNCLLSPMSIFPREGKGIQLAEFNTKEELEAFLITSVEIITEKKIGRTKSLRYLQTSTGRQLIIKEERSDNVIPFPSGM